MRLFTFSLTVFLVHVLERKHCHGHSDKAKLLLISFDGFRWDYLDMVRQRGQSTPHFDSLIKEGVVAERGMKNVFVTKTFPNHYSLVTGMYEENHGVVGNSMFDPRNNKTVHFTSLHSDLNKPDDIFWWNNGSTSHRHRGPEPIWVTNQKMNKQQQLFPRYSGVMFWPGSTANRIDTEKPQYYMHTYNNTFKNESRIDKIIEWFSTETKPINLGLLYFSEPDHTGHEIGPDDPRMVDMIVALDKLVGYLISELKKHHLFHHLNIIITSDHGMANVEESVILFDEDTSHLFEVCVGNSPGLNIKPKKGKTQDVLDHLSKFDKNIEVYVKVRNGKTTIPSDYHYSNNERILDIIVSAKLGSDAHCTKPLWEEKGNHGYNNSISEMHPFFIARGPAFKKNYVSTKQFNSVDVYPLICEILDIEPGPFDGSLENIEHILLNDEDHQSLLTLVTFLVSVMFAALIAGMISVAACRVYRITKLRRRHLVLPLNLVAGKVPLLADDDEEEIP